MRTSVSLKMADEEEWSETQDWDITEKGDFVFLKLIF